MIENLSFAFFSIVVLGFFCVAVFSKNLLYSLSSLALGMIFLSGFYFLLDAEFLGVIQIIVYSGAVLGLYSFAIMFFDANAKFKERIKSKKIFFSLLILSVILLLTLIFNLSFESLESDLKMNEISLFDINKQLALVIFSKYLLAFEFIGILLLIALVCAVILTHKDFAKEKQ